MAGPGHGQDHEREERLLVPTKDFLSARCIRRCALSLALATIGLASLAAAQPSNQADPVMRAVATQLQDPGTRLVAVDFFGTWCVPCAKEVSVWRDLQEQYGPRGFRLIVVSVASDGSTTPPGFRGSLWQPDDVVRDDDQAIKERWQLPEMPSAYLWAWDGGLIVKWQRAAQVKERVERYFRSALKIFVEPPVDGRGRRLKGDQAVDMKLLVQSELQRQTRYDVLVDEKQLAANIRRLIREAREVKREAEQCRVDQMVPANARLVVKLSQPKAGPGKLWLQLFPLEKGCNQATVYAPVGRRGPDAAVPLAVRKLVERLGGRGPGGSADGPSTTTHVSGSVTVVIPPDSPPGGDAGKSDKGPPPPPVAAAVGSLSVTGKPDRAKVEVHGPKGFNQGRPLVTNLPLFPPRTVPAGEYTVKVSSPGYDSVTEKKLIAALGVWGVKVKLELNTATLVLSGVPAGASTTIRCGPGFEQKPENVTQEPFGLPARPFAFKVPRGTCRVNASFVGWQSYEQEVTLAGGERKELRVEMSQRPAGPKEGEHGITWIHLPRGTFRMGSGEGDSDEKPVHRVTLDSFELMKTEVTVGMYRACLQSGRCSDDELKKSDWGSSERCNWRHSGREAHPMNCIDWSQASSVCEFLGGRLPTEAEWEYAARSGGRDITYPWGNEEATCDHAIMDDGGDGCGKDRTWPVCSKKAGSSAQGICDLAGNVWEWVADWYGSYTAGAQRNPSGPQSGSDRVGRGGSWRSSAGGLRAALRYWVDPGDRDVRLGARCARSF